MVTDKRLKLLEYKSIDQEARSRRNNLIFRGHPEVRYNDDCEAIIHSFLQRHLDIDPNLIRIQRAHRLCDLKYRPWGRAGVNVMRQDQSLWALPNTRTLS